MGRGDRAGRAAKTPPASALVLLAGLLVSGPGCGRLGFDPGGEIDGGIIDTCEGLPVLAQSPRGTLTWNPMDVELSLPVPGGVNPSRAFSFFSVSQEANPPGSGNVRCELNSATLKCARGGEGGTIVGHYHVVAFDSGVRVQRGEYAEGGAQSVMLEPGDPEHRFVVGSGGVSSGGGQWGGDDFLGARISGNTLVLGADDGLSDSVFGWQVVEIPSASVRRGLSTMAGVVLTVPVSVPADSFLLFTYQMPAQNPPLEAMTVHGRIDPNGTGLVFERAAAPFTLEIGWQIVTVPFAVQQFTAILAPGELSRAVALEQAVDPQSSVVFASNQATAGQSGGSADGASNLPAAALATFELDGAQSLQVVRGDASVQVQVSGYVVDFGSPRCP